MKTRPQRAPMQKGAANVTEAVCDRGGFAEWRREHGGPQPPLCVPATGQPRPAASPPSEQKENDPPASGAPREHQPILHLYLREIGRLPLLTEAEELALVERVRLGDRVAREQMIMANLRLVVHIARRYQDFGLPLLDLISEGNIGLMRAVDRFDPSHGRRLASYAGIWITQRIRRALANQGKLIRLPVHQVDRVIQLRRSSTQLLAELGREPTDEEIAEAMKLPVAKITRLRSAASPPASLDAALGDDTTDTLASRISDELIESPERSAERAGESESLHAALDSLPPRENLVLRARFGLDDGVERTLEEVGDKLGLTRERIRQIQNRALARLRRRLCARRMEEQRALGLVH